MITGKDNFFKWCVGELFEIVSLSGGDSYKIKQVSPFTVQFFEDGEMRFVLNLEDSELDEYFRDARQIGAYMKAFLGSINHFRR